MCEPRKPAPPVTRQVVIAQAGYGMGGALRRNGLCRDMHGPSTTADAERERAALALLEASEPAFRATARRLSLCAADADDAFQRSVEILLTKGPPGAQPDHLAAWMQ